MPIPDAGGSVQESPKRKRDDEEDPGDSERAIEDRVVDDPIEPMDEEVGELSVPDVLMPGERRKSPAHSAMHYGKYDICEFVSPSRVCRVASQSGLRGGWSLDWKHDDPITNRKYTGV